MGNTPSLPLRAAKAAAFCVTQPNDNSGACERGRREPRQRCPRVLSAQRGGQSGAGATIAWCQ